MARYIHSAHRGGPCVTQRAIIETQAAPDSPTSAKKSRANARAQGHRILICSRFALLIRRRCMLMRLTPYVRAWCVLYFQMPTVDVLREWRSPPGCRLPRGEPSPCITSSRRASLFDSHPAFIFTQRDFPLDSNSQISRSILAFNT